MHSFKSLHSHFMSRPINTTQIKKNLSALHLFIVLKVLQIHVYISVACAFADVSLPRTSNGGKSVRVNTGTGSWEPDLPRGNCMLFMLAGKYMLITMKSAHVNRRQECWSQHSYRFMGTRFNARELHGLWSQINII